ncbi:hypothetical protein H0B56_09360 [Haloechinothrix sp. YIM 98757]|uniref:Uncharacterized protein n=1 Tax=Haloechinothrix aidingensis TaxID=2752311 RepID=A0A837ZYP0_9PSEU|nr:hypothetical protein [Haloechinothrix aidingensis]MBA0125746.1 hypothetical protein [Haloechinothrix aidingensis]
MTKLRSQWDRLLAVAGAIAGAATLVTGWFGVSGTPYPAEQLPYIISGGIGGLFLLGISAALWLSADLHDEWRKLDRIERAIREAEAPGGGTGTTARTAPSPEPEPAREPTRQLPEVAVGGAS